MDDHSVEDINTIASFLANAQQATSWSDLPDIDTIVLCGSAILQCATSVFAALEANPRLAKTLVICGGVGHSTQLLYDTVRNHSEFGVLGEEIQGLPESRVLYRLFRQFFHAEDVEAAGLRVLIEDESTNCGANAVETVRLLEVQVIETRHLVIVQDPTMSIRTLAAFQKTYHGAKWVPTMTTFPTFVPKLALLEGKVVYDIPTIDTHGLWNMDRFCDLVLGEVPRLRDDERGYGPNGKDFIVHVDVSQEVEDAWRRLSETIEVDRATLKRS